MDSKQTYKPKELAEEWNISAESVRRYVRAIKADPALMDMGLLIVSDGGQNLITEAGREWMESRRKDTGRTDSRRESLSVQLDDMQEQIRQLEARLEKQETFYKERITFYEKHIETLGQALQAQQILSRLPDALILDAQNEATDAEIINHEYSDGKPENSNTEPKKGSWITRIFKIKRRDL